MFFADSLEEYSGKKEQCEFLVECGEKPTIVMLWNDSNKGELLARDTNSVEAFINNEVQLKDMPPTIFNVWREQIVSEEYTQSSNL